MNEITQIKHELIQFTSGLNRIPRYVQVPRYLVSKILHLTSEQQKTLADETFDRDLFKEIIIRIRDQGESGFSGYKIGLTALFVADQSEENRDQWKVLDSQPSWNEYAKKQNKSEQATPRKPSD